MQPGDHDDRPVNFTASHTFEFDIHYTVKCTGGQETCRGEIETLKPVELPGFLPTDLQIKTNKGKPLFCYGRCGRKSTGTFHIVGKSANDLRLKARRGKTFFFRFKLFCADKGQPKVNQPGASMTIVFNNRGFLDRKHSDFGD